ncbi:MAG: O-antigen ligase family protein [Microbacteriaceae bacterium]|nr:MAG: O-antigen ligase family protein [Microbacteriaceae bacterium]
MTATSAYPRVLGILGLATLLAGDAWRNLIGWWGWGAVVGVLLVLIVIEGVRARVNLQRVPIGIPVFLLLTLASALWSAYPVATVLGSLTTIATATGAAIMVARFAWTELVAMLAAALRWILGLSLLFELVVSLLVRERVLPFWVDWSDLDRIPAAFYWSRNLLLEGGRIQGIVGNANILGMLAVLALLVFGLRMLLRQGSPLWAWVWIVVAVATIALTRSSTSIAVLAALAVAIGYLVLVRRASPARRPVVHLAAAGAVVLLVAAVLVFRAPLLALLGKSSDLTYRFDIWDAVIGLWAERPAAGWGWVSYWAPWVEPFDDLVVIRGVTYLQAHNAWLDVMMQLGIVGLVVFGALVLGATARSWLLAIGAGDTAGDRPRPETTLPFLLMVALLVQSLAESRLLIEWGMFALIAISILTIRIGSEPDARPLSRIVRNRG